MKTDQTYFFPWVRKGLANSIPEADVFGNVADNDALAKMRAVLTIHTQYKAYPTEEGGEEKTLIDEKEIGLYGPADVSSVNPAAILKRRPEAGSKDFPVQYFPYVEFREPDLPWRYTPAQRTENRLTPWLALLCFRSDRVALYKDGKGLPVITFRGDKGEYEAAFPRMDVLWKTAHAQGPEEKIPTISRLICLRGADPETGVIPPMDEETEYIACLVPTYETGRLRGLGVDPEKLASLTAQTPAWVDYETQKGKERGMEFPVYYSWTFTTGGDSFEDLVKNLKVTTSGQTGVLVDVTRMGNGFDYDVLKCTKARPSIIAPGATRPPQASDEDPFPNTKAAESKLEENLRKLLGCNPVFLEDAQAIGQKPETPDGGVFADPNDDPCVVPPVYGARHVLATSLKEKDHAWISDLNLDIHYRIAAGLGRKVIIENQEVLMDRAWKQVEAVQALNMELYRRLLSMGANKSLKGKTVGEYGEGNQYLASLMFYLSSMKEAADAHGKDLSLASVLARRDVPTAFATATFHRMADRVARVVDGLSTKSVLQNILEYQTYRFPDHTIQGGTSIQDLRDYSEVAFRSIFQEILDKYLWAHFNTRVDYVPGVSSANERILHDIAIIYLPKWKVNYGGSLYLEYPSAGSTRHGSVGDQFWVDYSRIHVSPTSPVMWLYQYIQQNRYSVSVADNPHRDDEMLKDFFDNALHLHDCKGYVFDYSRMESRKMAVGDDCLELYTSCHNEGDVLVLENSVKIIPNLVALPGDQYERLFGKTLFTQLTDSGNGYFFTNLDALKRRKEEGDDQVDFWFHTLVGYQKSNVSGTMPVSKWTEMSFQGMGGVPTYSKDSYTGDYMDMIGSFGHLNDIPPKKREEYEHYRDLASEYMRTSPSFIMIDASKLPQMDLQRFNSMDEYREFLKAGSQDELFPYMHMWNQFNDLVAQLERDYPPQAEQQPEADPDDAGKLKAYMEEDPAYEEALEVVKNYYETFYADDAVGNRLREKYIDDLLRSKYPVLAYPIFPEPAYYYLRKFSEEMIVPGAGKLPQDSVSVFQANPAFVESYLAGMNTEMARELLWREYPTDQRGSYFRKFWDSESSKENIRKDEFFDIKPMHTWSGSLGGNMAEGKTGLVIFVLKGRLMRLYPTTRIYLWRAACDAKTKKLDYDPSARDGDGILRPVMETFLNEDTLLVGFKADFYDILGNPAQKDYGYFLAFQEDVEDLDFTVEKENDLDHPDAGTIADALKNDPSIYGKHISLFLQ
ncbi:MAG: hypothetical protein IJ255_07845 [Bacteroidales bacterium]|nr:hypothetical protein [Bacteroidales bacterium]